MRNTRVFLGMLLVVLALGWAPQSVQAQDGNIAMMYLVVPKTGAGAGFESALAQHAEWRRQHNDPWEWYVTEVVTGEMMGAYLIRSGGHQWADFDAYDAGFGPEGAVHFTATVMPVAESISNFIAADDTVNVRWPEDMRSVNLLSVVTYHLKPGMGQAFQQAIGKFHEAIMETGWPVHYSFSSLVSGGSGPAVSLVLPYEDWAAFAGPDQSFAEMMTEAYGEDEAQELMEQFSNSYTSFDTMVLRMRPDLSVFSGMGEQ